MSHEPAVINMILDVLAREWDLHGNYPDPRLMHRLLEQMPTNCGGESRLSLPQSYDRWLEAEACSNMRTRPQFLEDGRLVQVTIPFDGSDRSFNVHLATDGKLKIHHVSVKSTPGWWLQRLAQCVSSPTTYSWVLEPTLSDLATEHARALADERPWRARRVRLRGYWTFWTAVAAHVFTAMGRRLSKF